MGLLPILGGLFGIAAIVILITAIPHSYAVEARSNPERFGKKRFGYTNIWAVALNIGIAKDAETQALRRKVTARLAIIAALFAAMALIVALM